MTGITVGDRVRECRRSRKWSQAELAKKANISQVTISHVENNLSDQSKFLPQLASALGVSSEYLLSGKEYIEKSKGNLEDFIVIGGKNIRQKNPQIIYFKLSEWKFKYFIINKLTKTSPINPISNKTIEK